MSKNFDKIKNRATGAGAILVTVLGVALPSGAVFAEQGATTAPVSVSSTNGAGNVSSTDIALPKDFTELIAKAKAAGVDIKPSGVKTFESKAEAEKYVADKITELRGKLDQYQKDVEASKANSEKDKKAQEDYRKALDDYNKKVADAEKNKTKDGYLSEALTQSLIFESEPNAKLTITSKDGQKVDDFTYNLSKGQSLTATYENLTNTTYRGDKVSKVVYTYTANDASDNLVISKDPTITVHLKNNAAASTTITSNVHFKAQFYDSKGKLITFTDKDPAVFSLNSLNRSKAQVGTGHGESVVNLSKNARFVPISGSEVKKNGDWISSAVYNDSKENGSRFGANPTLDKDGYWDGPDRPNRWYGAGAAILASGDTIEFDIVNESKDAQAKTQGEYWFAFNSKVAVANLPVKPTEPTKTAQDPKPIDFKYETPKVLNTSYVDEGGNPIPGNPTEEGTKPKKDIPGWTFVKTEKDKDGNTRHIYKKTPEAKPTPKVDDVDKKKTRWVEEGKEGNPKDDLKTPFEGDNFQPNGEITGYTFVKSQPSADGKEMIHYFKRVTTPTPEAPKKTTTKYVDEGGNPIPGYPTKDGEQPKEDIPGWTFVRTDKDKDGNVTHVYKKNPEAPAKTETPTKTPDKKPDVKKPVQTGVNAGKFAAPMVGVGAGSAVLGLAKLVSKRKNRD